VKISSNSRTKIKKTQTRNTSFVCQKIPREIHSFIIRIRSFKSNNEKEQRLPGKKQPDMSNFSGISWIDLGATMSCGRRETRNIAEDDKRLKREMRLKQFFVRFSLFFGTRAIVKVVRQCPKIGLANIAPVIGPSLHVLSPL
jgi:hypothetical protein